MSPQSRATLATTVFILLIRGSIGQAAPRDTSERNFQFCRFSRPFVIKLPTAVIGAPLFFLVWKKWRWNFLNRPSLWLFAAITVLPSVAWYWHAYQIAENFYPNHLFGAGGIGIENFSWYWNITRRFGTSSLTPILTIMALIGLFVAPRSKFSGLFHWWFAAMILFIIVVGYGN